MYKLVVLFLVAAVAAEPGVFFSPSVTYSSVLSPVRTITKQASSVVHPVPVVYSTPWAYSHFIKKRSAPFFVTPTTYAAPSLIASTYTAAAPLIHTPLVHSTPVISSPITYSTHFIKKRSAPFFVTPTTYAAPSLIASTYTAAAPLIHTPLVHSTPVISSPITYSTHLIKKRSAPLLTTYVAPGSYSHQSRVDIINNAPLVKVTSFPKILHSYPYIY